MLPYDTNGPSMILVLYDVTYDVTTWRTGPHRLIILKALGNSPEFPKLSVAIVGCVTLHTVVKVVKMLK